MFVIKLLIAFLAIPIALAIDLICFFFKCLASIFFSKKEEKLYSETECKKRRLNRAEKRTEEFISLTATVWQSLFK